METSSRFVACARAPHAPFPCAPVFIVFCYLQALSVSPLPTTHRQQAEEKRSKRREQVAAAAARCRAKKRAAAKAAAGELSPVRAALAGATASLGAAQAQAAEAGAAAKRRPAGCSGRCGRGSWGTGTSTHAQL